jgi:glycerol-3-phosphate acyltransferase PlsY
VNIDQVIIQINALICAMITLRLMFFHKRGRHRRFMSAIAYVLIIACGWTAIRIWFGQYVQADPAEVFINFCICLAIWRARGNLSQLAGRHPDDTK